MEKPQSWYVYTYLLPDDTVFYVGKGTGDRINAHEREAASDCPCRKCEVIREIWASGKPVKKRLVFETLKEQQALTKEEELIREYASEHLTNIQGNNTSKVQGNDASKDTGPTEPAVPLQMVRLREDTSGEPDSDGMYPLYFVPANPWSITVHRSQS